MNSKRTYVFTIATLGLLGLGSSRPAAAQFTYIPDNTTIDAGHSIADSAIVGYADGTDYFGGVNGTSPTVDLVAGGSVGGSLFADNGSTINVSGGSITGALDAAGTSTINITGGTVGFGTQGYLAADGASNVMISGGQFGEVGNVDFIDGTSGSFNFVGTGIGATLIGGAPETGFTYQLSGTLQDGHSITGDRINVDTDSYSPSATPEPSSIVPFAIAGLVMLGLTHKARKRTASVGA